MALRLGLCLGPYGGPRGVAVSYKRGAPVVEWKTSSTRCRVMPHAFDKKSRIDSRFPYHQPSKAVKSGRSRRSFISSPLWTPQVYGRTAYVQ